MNQRFWYMGRVWMVVIALLATTSCKKDTKPEVSNLPAADKADLRLVFNNQVDGVPIVPGLMQYVNAAGNSYQVDVLKYYVSNIKLVKADSTEIVFPNYELINEKIADSKTVVLKDVPNASYTKVKFYIGVDLSHNHTGLQDGDLDPANDMIWDWNTGYVFFKHEGKYKNASGLAKPLTQHLATDEAIVGIEVPLYAVRVEGKSKSVALNFNLNSAYTSPNNINFNTDGERTSSGAADAAWKLAFAANMADAFTFAGYD